MNEIQLTLFAQSGHSFFYNLKIFVPIERIKAFDIGLYGETILINKSGWSLPVTESVKEIKALVRKAKKESK